VPWVWLAGSLLGAFNILLGLCHEFLNAQLKEGNHFFGGFQCPLDWVME